jgi:hypothetical protein
MRRFAFFAVVCLGLMCLAGSPCVAQTTPEKLAAIDDPGKWRKAELSIRKAMGKDSLSPEPPFLLALYFFSSTHNTFHVDSADHYQRLSARLSMYRPTSKKSILDSAALDKLRLSIDSAAFARAKRLDTEAGYQSFITHYRRARQIPEAIELRDNKAFGAASKTNTAKSLHAFLVKYPKSQRAKEARAKMDRLEFEEATKDKRLVSYQKFYKENPDNPHRSLAEKQIYEMMTASGSPRALLRFVGEYPESRWSPRVRAILFSLQREGESVPGNQWKSDSLRKEKDFSGGYWVPVIKSGRYGFINEQGKEVVSPRYESIPEGYRCGEISDRYVVVSRGLLARNGKMIWTGKVKDYDDLGLGFIYIATDSGGFVIHESGFRVNNIPADDAMVIANRLLGINMKDRWSLFTLTGVPLIEGEFDDLVVLDSVVQLTRNKKKILTTPSRIARVALGAELKEDLVLDETRKWGDQHYWVRNGVLEGVIDANLKFLIPLDRQVLRKTSFGFLATKGGSQYIEGIKTLDGKGYKQVAELGGWVRMKDLGGRHWLFDRKKSTLTEGDSVWFRGQVAFLQLGDSIRACLPDGRNVAFALDAPFQLAVTRDSAAFMVLDDKKKKTVYDVKSGKKLCSIEMDQVEPLTASLLLITKLGKKGLAKADGKIILPPEYDAIVSAGEQTFSLLREKKFGWFDARTGNLMKPLYDRNVKPYNARLWLAFRDNGYGFVQPDGKPIGPYAWEEVNSWSDSMAWVKQGGTWKLIEILTQKIKLDNVRSFKIISEGAPEKLAIVQQDKAYGVVSSRRGVIVPIQYTDVINLGTRELPLYYSERFITEAGITVIVYFDHRGKTVRSQALEADELEKITCDN